MELLPIITPLLRPGDKLAALLYKGGDVRAGDIVVVSSKAVATVENAFIELAALTPSADAHALSLRMHRSPAFCEAMLGELRRLDGKIIDTVPGAALTVVRPSTENVTPSSPAPFEKGAGRTEVMVASAGLDESNAGPGLAIGWPRDPVMSVRSLRKELEKKMNSEKLKEKREKLPLLFSFLFSLFSRHTKTPGRLAVIMTDSTCMPRRHGVTAFALAVSGLDPLHTKGRTDLFGKPLLITTEAVADQLATAANFLMGNGAQSIPAVIIRGHGLELSEWEGWVPGIPPEADLFRGIV